MFERLTEASIKVVMIAQEEAERLHHDHVAAEHIFLGLIGAEKGMAAKELKKVGITFPKARTVVEGTLGRGEPAVDRRKWWQKIIGFREMPFEANAKQLLEQAWAESRQLDVNYIGTEHLLLSLLNLDDERVREFLRRCEVDRVSLQAAVLDAIRTRKNEKET